MHEDDWDLIVAGAGMAGLTAASRAASAGQRVLVLESAPAIGGSAIYSGGYVWTAGDLSALRREDPAGDAALASVVVETYESAIEWIRRMGVNMTGPVTVLGFGRGYHVDLAFYFQRCIRQIESAGGAVACSTDAIELIADCGRVVGVTLNDEGTLAEARAKAVILATGGFQANDDMVRTYISSQPYFLRGTTHSRGDGLLMATSAGAAKAGVMDSFYGHLMVEPQTTELTLENLSRFSQYHSDSGILLNLDGERFADETRGDHRNAQALVKQREGRGILVLDDEARKRVVTNTITSNSDKFDRVADAKQVGARAVSADDLASLAAETSAWGYPEQRVRASLEGALEGPKAVNEWSARKPVPPFHAVEVISGVTFTQGGIRTDSSMHALTPDGGVLPGLLVAGADVGGAYAGGYGGGLALACTTGLVAADSVL